MLRVAIVEDDRKDQEMLNDYLRQYEASQGQEFNVRVFEDGSAFLEGYKPDYDVVMMDIRMPVMDGLKAAQYLRESDEAVCLVFVTNISQYAIRGYEYNATDFLIKPFSYFDFKVMMDKVVRNCRLRRESALAFQTEDGMVRIMTWQIYYIQSDKHYVQIVTRTQSYRTRCSMKQMEGQLPREKFFRCDNSVIVNLDYVVQITRDTVKVGPFQLPVSRLRRKNLIDAFTCYLGGKG